MKTNRSAVRAIEIIHLLATSQKRQTISTLSLALKIPKSTTYQIVQTLLGVRVVEADEASGALRLGPRFYEIALPSLGRMDLRREARPIMEELGAKSGETVFLVSHDEGEIIYLDQVEGPSMLKLSVSVGSRAPIHCTALGKAILAALAEDKVREILKKVGLAPHTEHTITDPDRLLADLRETRRRGYALDLMELLPDIACVAAPVYGGSGRPVGALSVASPASRMTPARHETLGRHIQKAALDLSRRLGFQGQGLYQAD